MKQKITIEAQFRCQKCRSKAMEIAVAEDGVVSVTFQGANKDQMVITGDGVDAACVTKALKKKLGYANLLRVEEITEKKAEHKSEPKQEKKSEPANSTPLSRTNCSHHPHQMEFYIHEPPSGGFCTIL